MKRLGHLFALCCLFAVADASAVGLGKLRVLSALDQPLDAEIELLSTTPAELKTHKVGLASRSDFTRAGVEWSTVLSEIKFKTEVRDNGDAYVRLTTDNPVSEPFLHLLVNFEWFGGKLTREYTALLDPPLYAQGRPASVSSPRVASRPAATAGGGTVTQVPGAPSPVRAAMPPAVPARGGGGVYGPIGRGETLSQIVAGMNLPAGVDMFQAMIAMLQRNPEAFILGNINLIKEGSTVALPTAEEMASISKVAASAEYTKQLNAWLAYRTRVAGAQLAAGPSPARTMPLPQTGAGVAGTPTTQPEQLAATGQGEPSSGLSEDVLRIIQSDGAAGASGAPTGGDGGEINALRSQLSVMEESLLSTELENKELRKRLASLEEQIKETNKLLRIQNTGLAMAQNSAAGGATGDTRGATGATDASDAAAPAAGSEQVRVTTSSSLREPLAALTQGDALWKLLLALAGVVLLIGIIVYFRRRQSYAEFEETMMTGNAYDMRSQSSAFTQMPPTDSTQISRPSQRADSQQSGSLLQTSFMTEMGAPGMGAMQADEVDPVAEAEVYMAYGRDQQAMEVLQDAIRRDPSRSELKIKLLEVFQKRKDARAFESLAEELYPVIGKDPARWQRVTEMGRRVSPRHPLFAAAPGGASTRGTSQISGRTRSLDRDSGSLDLISAPVSRGRPSITTPSTMSRADESLELPSSPGRFGFEEPRRSAPKAAADTGGLHLDSDQFGLRLGDGISGTPESLGGDSFGEMVGAGTLGESMDDFRASEIATKLDLAKAYLEMGDKDAARGFIEEVLKEGNEAQRQQASELAGSF